MPQTSQMFSDRDVLTRKVISLIILLSAVTSFRAQTINGAHAKALQQKYPSAKSELCAGCKRWINPYFRSVADTSEHRPLVTYYVYTEAHRLLQEQSDLP